MCLAWRGSITHRAEALTVADLLATLRLSFEKGNSCPSTGTRMSLTIRRPASHQRQRVPEKRIHHLLLKLSDVTYLRKKG